MARVLKDDHTGRMWQAVLSFPGGISLDPLRVEEASRIDREQIPGMVAHLREAEANTRRLRGQLEALLNDSDRRCPVCDVAVTGRADQVYCGATCRQRARRLDEVVRQGRGLPWRRAERT